VLAPTGHERAGIDELLAVARARLRRLAPAEAREAARAGGLIVDIRSEHQREAQGLVPGAHFVARNVLEWRADPRCPHHDPVLAAVRGPLVLMCAQGFQSSLAAATLQDLGLANATDMEGGFERWQADGLPVLPAGVGDDCAAGRSRLDP
jgi:rhodanese-related sulfurtransferase